MDGDANDAEVFFESVFGTREAALPLNTPYPLAVHALRVFFFQLHELKRTKRDGARVVARALRCRWFESHRATLTEDNIISKIEKFYQRYSYLRKSKSRDSVRFTQNLELFKADIGEVFDIAAGGSGRGQCKPAACRRPDRAEKRDAEATALDPLGTRRKRRKRPKRKCKSREPVLEPGKSHFIADTAFYQES